MATKSDADIKNTDVSLDIGTDKHKNHKVLYCASYFNRMQLLQAYKHKYIS